MKDAAILPELKRLAGDGVNLLEISRMLGVSKGVIYRIAGAHGITARNALAELDMKEVKRMFDSGVPYSVMHKLLNVTEHGLRRVIRNQGWTRERVLPNSSPIQLAPTRDNASTLADFDASGHAKCEDCKAPTHGNRCSPCAVKYIHRIYPPRGSSHEKRYATS